jgi:hypothetical protein
MKFKIAVYEYTPTGGCSSLAGHRIVTQSDRSNDSDVIRVSEFKEVEFEPVPFEDVLPTMLNNLDAKIEEIKNKALEECAKLNQQKQELLAITQQV